MKLATRILAPVLGLALIGSAQAAVITGISATATSTFTATGGLSAALLVNTTDLSIPNDITATHAVFSGSANGNGWHSNGPGGPGVDNEFITLNLNGTYDLDSIYIWQMNQTNNLGRGVRQFDILVSNNGTDFTEVGSNLVLAQALNGTLPNTAQAFALTPSSVTGVTHVRIGIDTAWSGSATEYVGLNHIMVTAIPEPSAALLGGLGMLALLRRRR